jgi:hypothetical protein
LPDTALHPHPRRLFEDDTTKTMEEEEEEEDEQTRVVLVMAGRREKGPCVNAVMHDSLFPRPTSGIAMTLRAPCPRLVLPPAVCEDV